MNLKTFLKKFELFADAPDAVAKMRELALNLAFKGKLSESSSTTEWSEETLGDISTATAPGFACGKSNVVEGGHVHLRTHNVSTLGILNFDLKVEIDPAKVDPKKASLQKNDILFNNTNSQELVGKTALVDQDYPFGFSNHLTRIRLKDHVDPPFFVYYFKLLRDSGYFASICTRWINQAGINTKLLEKQVIPLPPLAEQRRIVAKVDALMALCDQLEAQQAERQTRESAIARAALARFADAPNPQNLNLLFHKSYQIPPADLRKSILTLAVQGKLVPQDPGDEPAEQLVLSKVKKPAPRASRDVPFDLPNSWQWKQLGDISELINGDRSKNYPNKNEYVNKGVAWINTGHIEPDGTLSIDSMHYITREKFNSLRSGKIRPGDLVYCLRGATLGKTAIITQFEEGAVASSLVIIRLSQIIDQNFAYRFLTSPPGREQIFHFDNGSAQPNLSANSVKKYWLPLPPLTEQRRIIAKVDQLMVLVDELETQLEQSRITAKNLLETLVAELTVA